MFTSSSEYLKQLIVISIRVVFVFFFVFFFFQAEDGIRDWSVTGVQTCALPIYPGGSVCVEVSPPSIPNRIRLDEPPDARVVVPRPEEIESGFAVILPPRPLIPRSEERRVGKECRSRWSAAHYEKKI